MAPDGREGFTINPGREAEWEEILHPRWHFFQEHGKALFWWLVGTIGGAILGALMG